VSRQNASVTTLAPPRRSRFGLDRFLFACWLAAAAFTVEVALLLVAGYAMLTVAFLHVAAFSALAFVLFAVDKSRAGAGRRVAESNLHGLAWLGGAPGALAAMTLLRHKTRKPSFRFGVPAALFFNIVVLGWIWISR